MIPKQPLHLLLNIACVAVLSATSASAASTYLLDFGMNGSNAAQHGSPTLGQDANGNYWNNLTSSNYAATVQPGGPGSTSLANLVDTTNVSSSIGIAFTTGTVSWSSSGIINGGLNQSIPSLGNLGITTATQDYYFVQGATGAYGTVTLTGLNPSYLYSLGLFGTRGDTNDVRTTSYGITDINGTQTLSVQTSGPGIGVNGGFTNNNGNDSTVVNFNNLSPNALGELSLRVSIVNGGFAYLGAMALSVPEPGSVMLGGLGGVMLLFRRRRVA